MAAGYGSPLFILGLYATAPAGADVGFGSPAWPLGLVAVGTPAPPATIGFASPLMLLGLAGNATVTPALVGFTSLFGPGGGSSGGVVIRPNIWRPTYRPRRR